jgi:hypothetical protein
MTFSAIQGFRFAEFGCAANLGQLLLGVSRVVVNLTDCNPDSGRGHAVIVSSSFNRWRHYVYRIAECECGNGQQNGGACLLGL